MTTDAKLAEVMAHVDALALEAASAAASTSIDIEATCAAVRSAVTSILSDLATAKADARRWQAITGWAVRNDAPDCETFDVTYQPCGYNGGKHHWLEIGWPGTPWQKPTKEEIDAAADFAIAYGETQ